MDWALLVFILLLAAHGFFRGLLAQIFGTVGVGLGLWAGAGIAHWVGARWTGAHPALAFWALRWLVALLGGLAVASVFGLLGEAISRALRRTPLGWLDRGAGFFVGIAIGSAFAALVILGTMNLPGPRDLVRDAGAARLAPALLHGGATACRLAPWVPGATPLGRRFSEALRRVSADAATV